jgi:hypothetical protein
MYTLGALGVTYDPARLAWSQWTPGRPVDPYDIPDEIIGKWIETSPGQRGWHPTSQSGQVGCYCWGYRPANRPPTLGGARWANQITPWKICEFACTQSCPPQQSCPTPQPCPPQQSCPTPAPCPVVEPSTCPTCPAELADVSRSHTWIWLVGAAFAVTAVYGVRRTMALRRK